LNELRLITRNSSKLDSIDIAVLDYHEHALTAGSDASAAAYVEVESPTGRVTWGAGLSHDILAASLQAIVGAANRLDFEGALSTETAEARLV